MGTVFRRIFAPAAAGLLVLSSVASAGQFTLFGGTTSQKVGGSPLRISLSLNGGSIANIQLSVLVRKGSSALCRSAEVSPSFSKGKITIRKKKFDGTLKDGQGDFLTISGRVKGKTIAGLFTVKATGGAVAMQMCSSGNVRFTAKPSGGQADHSKYSGTVGPGYPMSFRVAGNGKAVDDLVMAFEETCNGSAGSTPPKFRFSALAIKSGQFSGTSIDHFGATESETLHVTGSFFGRVAVGQVSDISHIKSLPNCTERSGFTAKAQ